MSPNSLIIHELEKYHKNEERHNKKKKKIELRTYQLMCEEKKYY